MTFFDQRKRLWKEGVSTLAYVSPETSFSKEKRFKLHSIYWPEKSQSAVSVCKKKSSAAQLGLKVSRVIDEEQKNQRRITIGKKSYRKSIRNSQNKQTHSLIETKATMLSQKNQEITKRLAQTTTGMKLSKLRDRHGIRTTLFENFGNYKDDLLGRVNTKNFWSTTDKGFSTTKRMRLELPDNYYPGPGSYDIQRYLENRAQINK